MSSFELIQENRAGSILFKALSQLEKGTKVLLPCNACPILPLIIYKCGLSPVMLNIDDSFEISKDDIFKQLDIDDVSALIFIRPFGYMQDRHSLFSEIKTKNSNILIIDDQCLSIPKIDLDQSEIDKNVDILLFSTGYSKYVDLGGGGFAYVKRSLNYAYDYYNDVTDNSAALMVDLVEYSKKGIKYTYNDSDWLAISKPTFSLAEYSERIIFERTLIHSHKRRINEIYDQYLPPEIKTKFKIWRYNLNVTDSLIEKSIFEKINNNKNTFCSCHYPNLSGAINDDVEPKKSNVLNLFNDKRYTIPKALETVKIINDVLGC